MSNNGAGKDQYWIYHERQQALLCGQHALNNLVQQNCFSPQSLSEIAQQLDAVELNYFASNCEGGVRSKDYLQRLQEGSGNVDESGNFSIEVLRSALLGRFGAQLPSIRQQGVAGREITEIDGFICKRAAHWFAIRKINGERWRFIWPMAPRLRGDFASGGNRTTGNTDAFFTFSTRKTHWWTLLDTGRYWNLNSTKDRPEVISHFRLAAEVESLQSQGYSVFCVLENLPAPCTCTAQMDLGLPEYWWKEEDLLKGKTDATTRATDPWRGAGSGRRLDGGGSASAGGGGGGADISGLSEEEMLQMAMAASLEQGAAAASAAPPQDDGAAYALTDEPADGAEGSCKIQFRLPDGTRTVRRFLTTDPVGSVYAFVASRCDGGGRRVELRSGFPPKDLSSAKDKTVGEAGLAGDMIQGRYI